MFTTWAAPLHHKQKCLPRSTKFNDRSAMMAALLTTAFISSAKLSYMMCHTGLSCPLHLSSTQGCNRACKFCATGRMGWLRDLSPDEILAQVFFAKRAARLAGMVSAQLQHLCAELQL